MLSPESPLSIQTQSLNRHFGDFQAVQNLNLEVPQGAFFGFLGPNGAGKSTTIKMLTGLLQPSSGQIQILGQDIWKHPELIKRQIGVVPEKLHLFERLTAQEYLEFVGAMYGSDQALTLKRSAELLELMELDERRELLIADFSHGMKKKLALAAALIHNPRLLFLDEPFEGVDAVSARILRDLLTDLTTRQVTIFLTSHILEIVEKLCDHLAIIHKGRLIAIGRMDEVLARLGDDQPLGTASLEDAFIQIVGPRRGTQQLSWMQ